MKKDMPMARRKRKISSLALAAFWLLSLCSSPALAGQEPSTPLKALIVTGQNFHDWRVSSAALKQMLEDTDLFQVDIAASPPAGADMKSFRPPFSAYQLVVLDYSGDAWPRATQKAFVDFVKNGGGVVVYHSADNTFPDWPEYNEIIGLAGWGNRTEKAGPYIYWKDGGIVRDTQPGIAGYHTPPHPFAIVNRDTAHPITAGLPQKWMHGADELYSLLRGPAKNLNVLATALCAYDQAGTDRHEPVLFTVSYGAGRVFHTVLGHLGAEGPQPAIECAGFIVTFQRGAEWAATGRVTQKIPGDFPATERDVSTPADVRLWPAYRPPSLDALLKEFAAFEHSRDEAVLYRLRAHILAHKNAPESRLECEAKFLAFLESDARPAAKMEACRYLRLIGGEKSAAVLGEMLLREETADMSRFALEKIPGAAADKALLNALAKTQGAAKIGLISSLGQRKCQAAVPELASLLADQDGAVASAAATALGRIGGSEAAAILTPSLDRAGGEQKAVIASALLACAEEFLAHKDKKAAGILFEKIYTAEFPPALSQAALRGKIASAEKDEAARLIMDTLVRGPEEMRAPAIGLISQYFDGSSIASIGNLLPKLSEASQIQVLAVLSGFPRKSVLPFVLNSARSQFMSVRLAALKALAKVGDPSTVVLLAERAAAARSEEQDIARTSLWSIPGKDVDEAVLFHLISHPDEAVRNELVRAIGERLIEAGKSLLISQAGSLSFRNTQPAAKALRAIASPQDIPVLAAILLETKEETAAEEMQNTIAALAQKISDPYGRAAAIEEMLEPAERSTVERIADADKRSVLFRLLGRIGDDSSLPLLRAALGDENADLVDAAVRTLMDWPTPAPREDLLSISRTSENLTHRVLALRGYVRMIGLEKYQSPEGAVHSLQAALETTTRPEEVKLVLGAAAEFPCSEALKLAESFLALEAVQEEAQAAVTKIKEAREPPQKNP